MTTANEQKLQSRPYQIEMFQESIRSNIIVAMGTGLGKTHVASLRIDYELLRNPTKRIWLTAPNVVLAEQQHAFLSSQLPQYRMRTLLGHDNVDLWRKQSIWDQALTHMHVVISTPQVLLDGLRNAFLHLEDISLLVIDEAHHCQANSPGALIMKEFYHPLKRLQSSQIPHILGLTASSQVGKKIESTKTLEMTLDAKCRTPTRSIEDYKEHTFLPQIVPLKLVTDKNTPASRMMEALSEMMQSMSLKDDPYYNLLRNSIDLESEQKCLKYEKKGTPAMADLKALVGNAHHIHESLGPWASDYFVKNCMENWHQKALKSPYQERYINEQYIDTQLSRLQNMRIPESTFHELNMSQRVRCLIEFLRLEYREGIAIIVFVERRSAAFVLCELLRRSLPQYRVFSFVGLATLKRSSLIEVADLKIQMQAFADFRAGSQDICVATSVAEEGIDIQAVNIVVRFDDPKTFVSFVQSRGRARCQNSKFIYFQDINCKPGKYADWQILERFLQEEYRSQMCTRQLVLDAEEQDEGEGADYIVQSTGALLNFHNAKTHLQQFCDTLPNPAKPIYVFSGNVGIDASARVVLPSSLPAYLQQFAGANAWLTQKQAGRDAAFQACKNLHAAGLIDDHLIPFRTETAEVNQERHGFRKYNVEGEEHIWTSGECTGLYAHRLEVLFTGTHLETKMILVLPKLLPHILKFPLCKGSDLSSFIVVHPLGRWTGDLLGAKELTESLFASIFDMGSAYQSLKAPNSISVLIVPQGMQPADLRETALAKFLTENTCVADKRPFLLWRSGRRRPYLCSLPQTIRPGGTIAAVPIKKLQLYTHIRDTANDQVVRVKELNPSECHTKGAGTILGPIVLLIPSILHILESCFRAEAARQKVFPNLIASPNPNLTAALLAPSAAGVLNYERLEFLGDTMLKFYTSFQVFFQHPDAHEGILTSKSKDILSNMRLETAIQDMGLVPYMTTEAAVQKHWTVPTTVDMATTDRRTLDSKILADYAESVLAAVFLDGCGVHQSDQKGVQFLQLLLPEVNWRTPLEWINGQTRKINNQRGEILRTEISNLLGYRFSNPALLLEALTHSSHMPGQRSLDRLEFIGDAIIDRILKQKLYESTLDAGTMTKCRHALASHYWFAYCALGSQVDIARNEITTTPNKRTVQISKQLKPVHLTDLISTVDATLREQIAASRKRHSDLREQIEVALSSAFPWTALRAINAPKVCSDIVESLIAAIYLDTRGSLAECERVLDRLGVTRLIERMVVSADRGGNDTRIDDKPYIVETPAARLREFCATRKLGDLISITAAVGGGGGGAAAAAQSKGEGGKEGYSGCYVGTVSLDGVEIVKAAGGCRQEAESRAAELALEKLNGGCSNSNGIEGHFLEEEDVVVEEDDCDTADEDEDETMDDDNGVSVMLN